MSEWEKEGKKCRVETLNSTEVTEGHGEETQKTFCVVFLEILEVTSLSVKLLKQTSENIFQGKETKPYTIWRTLY